MAQLEGTLAGFELRARDVHGIAARAGASPDGPRVVLLPVASDYTVMTLSYESSLDELIEWTMISEPWTRPGGSPVVASSSHDGPGTVSPDVPHNRAALVLVWDHAPCLGGGDQLDLDY